VVGIECRRWLYTWLLGVVGLLRSRSLSLDSYSSRAIGNGRSSRGWLKEGMGGVVGVRALLLVIST